MVRQRKAMMASNLIKNVLGANGVVFTKVHGGMPHVDMGLVAEECEKLDVNTAVSVQPYVTTSFIPSKQAYDGYGALEDSVLFDSDILDLIIPSGALLETIKLPLDAEKILGGDDKTKIRCPDNANQQAGDQHIFVEEFLIAGVHDYLGSSRFMVKQY